MFQNFLCDKACVCAKLVQSCPTLCDPMDCSPSGSSMGFSRQEYWSGLPCPPPGDLSNPEISNTCLLSLLHCRQILYALDHLGSLCVIIFPLFKTQLAPYCLYIYIHILSIYRMMLKLLRITHDTLQFTSLHLYFESFFHPSAPPFLFFFFSFHLFFFVVVVVPNFILLLNFT